MAQATLAAGALSERHPGEAFVLEPIDTRGDRAPTMPLLEASQEGIFVKELEQALLDGRAEIAVHSAKDLPTKATAGLVLAAFLPRADARDVLVAREAATLSGLHEGARIGTGSPRRTAQLAAQRGDLRFVPIRGNVDTRLNKLRQGQVDALVLAGAGLLRLDRIAEVHEWLPFSLVLPAPGQGALVLQTLKGNRAQELVRQVDHAPTRRAVEAERAVLRGLGGGCLSAVGAYAELVDGQLSLTAAVLAEDGSAVVRAAARGHLDDAVVDDVVARLQAGGANRLLRERGPKPLSGVRVMVTRAASQAEGFTRALKAAGAAVVVCPVIRIEAIEVTLPDPDGYDWVVFTSVNGVDRFFELLGQRGLGNRVRIAAIGPETAAALVDRGAPAQIVPRRFVAEELAAALPASVVRGARILIPRAAGGREVLPEQLRKNGARVDVLETYRAIPPDDLRHKLEAAMRDGVDVITLTSSSAVRHLVEALGASGLPSRTQLACVGPVTAETAREAGLPVAIIAEEYTTRGLLEALIRHQPMTAQTR
jgi:hydroxymethylbilane synthase